MAGIKKTMYLRIFASVTTNTHLTNYKMNLISLLLKALIFSSIKSISEASVRTEKTRYILQEPIFGRNILIHCDSVDSDHLFSFWEIPDDNKTIVVGPSNTFDTRKYDYKVLSGDLIIMNVTVDEPGLYDCISTGVRNSNVKIATVKITVKKNVITTKAESKTDHFGKVVRVVVCFSILLAILSAIYLCKIKRVSKSSRRQSIFQNYEEDENSDNEVYSQERTIIVTSLEEEEEL